MWSLVACGDSMLRLKIHLLIPNRRDLIFPFVWPRWLVISDSWESSWPMVIVSDFLIVCFSNGIIYESSTGSAWSKIKTNHPIHVNRLKTKQYHSYFLRSYCIDFLLLVIIIIIIIIFNFFWQTNFGLCVQSILLIWCIIFTAYEFQWRVLLTYRTNCSGEEP